ncbi:MAG TPA: hypothetical protein VIH28_08450 [Ignavibacteriaceae bacterium]
MENLQSSELRIGNLVLIDGDILGKISEIRSNHAKILYKGEVNSQIGERFSLIDYDRIKPIPITKEWLIRFGFEGTEFLIGFGNFICSPHNNILTWFGVSIHNSLWNEVHKFQNLHYALTGQELFLKNK